MTREQITNTTAYYRMFRAGSWVSVPRDGLLDALAALEAAWNERDQLTQQMKELERGEYICKKCGLWKDGESQPADF